MILMGYWNLICDLMFLLKNHLILIGSDFQKSKKGVHDMRNMKKTFATLLAFSVITVAAFGSCITAYASNAIPSRDTEPVCTTPGGVYVYGRYWGIKDFCSSEQYITRDFPVEYLMAIDAAGITNEMGDYEKCVRINNYLCAVAENGVFDVLSRTKPRPEGDNFPVSDGLDLIQYGKGVCHNYADAFTTMATMLGIENGGCSSVSMNHTWNYVVIDGVTYYVDVTWNDMVTYVNGVELTDSTNKNRYLMATELWEDHKASDIVYELDDRYAEDIEAEWAAKDAEWAAIIDAFMKDPEGYFEYLDEVNPDAKTYVWDPETCMWRVLQQ